MTKDKLDGLPGRVRALVERAADLVDELNQCLQIIVTNAGNARVGLGMGTERHRSLVRIEEAVKRAAKATRLLAALEAPPAVPVDPSANSASDGYRAGERGAEKKE